MKILLVLFLGIALASCRQFGGDHAIKDQDIKTPCAGCGERVYPRDNNKYIV